MNNRSFEPSVITPILILSSHSLLLLMAPSQLAIAIVLPLPIQQVDPRPYNGPVFGPSPIRIAPEEGRKLW
jgi:hypothetical protein